MASEVVKAKACNFCGSSERRRLASCHFCPCVDCFLRVHFSSEKALPLLLVSEKGGISFFSGNKCSKDGQVVSTNKAIQVMSAHNGCAAPEYSRVWCTKWKRSVHGSTG